MNTVSPKLISGIIVGAAIGIAIGALLLSDRKKEFRGDIEDSVDKVKKTVDKAINQGIEEVESTVDKVNTIAQTLISRAKAVRTTLSDEV
jgi:hypothetical protein